MSHSLVILSPLSVVVVAIVYRLRYRCLSSIVCVILSSITRRRRLGNSRKRQSNFGISEIPLTNIRELNRHSAVCARTSLHDDAVPWIKRLKVDSFRIRGGIGRYPNQCSNLLCFPLLPARSWMFCFTQRSPFLVQTLCLRQAFLPMFRCDLCRRGSSDTVSSISERRFSPSRRITSLAERPSCPQ